MAAELKAKPITNSATILFKILTFVTPFQLDYNDFAKNERLKSVQFNETGWFFNCFIANLRLHGKIF